MSEQWYKRAIFYQIYLRAFADGNGDGIGDFQGLTAHLEYFQELGVDCLWLMPIYPSPLCDDGYDIADYYGIHPDFGTLEDFKAFLDEAHRRGLRVILDLVLNHTSNQHPWFQSARLSPSSPYRDFYVWSDTDQKYSQARIIFLDVEKSNWTWDEIAGQFYWHRFYACQPDLNYDNPAVRAEMLRVMKFWLDLGVDGFRADAVPYLFEREGTNCENLPETHAYLKEVRRFLDLNYPGRILLAEANQWPKDVRQYFGEGDEFHMAFHFPLMPRLYMALAQADTSPILDILAQTPPIPENCQWCTFLRNHDELTLEMVTPEERDFMWRTYAPEPRMRLNLGIRRRLASLMEGDRRRIELLFSLLFTIAGSPIIYYGDEIGMGDNIWLEDRNGVRTPMQWTDGLNAGFSTASPEQLYAPLINDERFGFRVVNVAAQRRDPASLWHQVRRMILVRKAEPALNGAESGFLTSDNRSVLAQKRRVEGQVMILLHNLAGEEQRAEVSVNEKTGATLRCLLSGRRLSCEKGRLKVTLQPYEYLWLKLTG